MRHNTPIMQDANEMDNLMSVCCGTPQGDELPQVAGEEDILMDIYSDILNMPREYASARFNHQYSDEYEYEYDGYIH